MIYEKNIKPSPHLQEYVKSYFLLHFDFRQFKGNRPTKAYTPRPEQCLIFDPKGVLTVENLQTNSVKKRAHSYFMGQQTNCWNISFDTEYLMVKVIFQTGAMYRLLGIPSFEFQSIDIDSDCILPAHEIKSVNEQLLNTQSYAEMINIIERYMTSKIKNVKTEIHPIDRIADMITHNPTTFSLDDYARKAFLSSRQFDRKFVERIGITPRLFQRIARFHHAFEMKDKDPRLDWLSVAYNSGYTDYQHLVKDFKTFSTFTPTLLLDRNSECYRPEKILKLL